MATLIPNMVLKELYTRLLAGEVVKACEVFRGEIKEENCCGTFIPLNPYDSVVADRIRTKTEFLGCSNNSIYPLEVIEKKEFVCDECGTGFDIKIALAGHKRSHKKELVEV